MDGNPWKEPAIKNAIHHSLLSFTPSILDNDLILAYISSIRYSAALS